MIAGSAVKSREKDCYLNSFYETHDEEERLQGTNHGRVEFLTTMKYIHEYLKPGAGVIEVGAGTGRYAVALAREGYAVTALELVGHNLERLRAKLRPGDCIDAQQGHALDLSRFPAGAFDAVLLLGPMYHLFTQADQVWALCEAKRVVKPGGLIFSAYCMNEATVLEHCFLRGKVEYCLENGMLTEDFQCLSKPEDVFVMMRTEAIDALNRAAGLKRLKRIATDGAARYLHDALDAMDEAMFGQYLRYHFATCERPDLLGASHHTLDILEKEGTA